MRDHFLKRFGQRELFYSFWRQNASSFASMTAIVVPIPFQRKLFLSEVNNRETKATIHANDDICCLQKTTRKVPTDSELCWQV